MWLAVFADCLNSSTGWGIGSSTDKEVNVELCVSILTGDKVRGGLENIETGGLNVGVVTNDVPQVPVPQVVQLAWREWVRV